MVSTSSSILLTSFSAPQKPFQSFLFRKTRQLQGSFWNCLLTSTRYMNKAASPNFLLSVPSTTWTKVWNLAIQLMTSSLERLSPMKSVSWYLWAPRSMWLMLLEMDGTVSKDLPPDRANQSCVLPEPRSPTTPIYFLLPLALRLEMMKKTAMRTSTAIMYMKQFGPDSQGSGGCGTGLEIVVFCTEGWVGVELVVFIYFIIFYTQVLYINRSFMEDFIKYSQLRQGRQRQRRQFLQYKQEYTKNQMNRNARILPPLTMHYLQKKAYDVHRKKIDYIKQSLKHPISKTQPNILQRNDRRRPNPFSDAKMSTIRQQIQPKQIKLKPYDKRKRYECDKQNHRLIKRITTCSSTINRKDLRAHMERNREIVSRMSKFTMNAGTNKTELKSQHSFKAVDRIKEKRNKIMTARRESVQSIRHSRFITQQSQTNQKSISSFSANSPKEKNMLSKKNSFDKFMVKRNSSKIKKHFGREDFVSRAQVKLQVLKKNASIEIGGRQPHRSQPKRKGFSCFPTELQTSN